MCKRFFYLHYIAQKMKVNESRKIKKEAAPVNSLFLLFRAHLSPHPKQAVLGQLVHAEIGCFHFFRQLFREPQLHEAGFRVEDGGGEFALR